LADVSWKAPHSATGSSTARAPAPDVAARDRAYALANGVDGGVAVNNELVIKPS
jgi:hypothetical protein